MALWGGRFSNKPTDAVFALSQSISFDWRLAPYDLRSSLAHLAVLEKAALISKDDSGKIRGALKELIGEVSSGKFLPDDSDEDVHSALERGLTEKLGTLGGALRAGRAVRRPHLHRLAHGEDRQLDAGRHGEVSGALHAPSLHRPPRGHGRRHGV